MFFLFFVGVIQLKVRLLETARSFLDIKGDLLVSKVVF